VKRGDGKMRWAMEDERFAPARTDPRFRPMRRKDAKVALDSRFNSMRTDLMFASSEAPVDKRGRRCKKGARENPLLHCYLDREEGIEKEKEKEKLIREEEEDEQDEEQSSSSGDDEDVGEDHQVIFPFRLCHVVLNFPRSLLIIHMLVTSIFLE
jgi:hypothetical protein